MLALVKAPHTEIELSFNGSGIAEFLDFLKSHYSVKVVSEAKVTDPDEELIDIEDSEFWKRNKHRVLTGARLHRGITQKQLSERTGIRQSIISEYEKGKRKITPKVAQRLAKALDTYPEKFISE